MDGILSLFSCSRSGKSRKTLAVAVCCGLTLGLVGACSSNAPLEGSANVRVATYDSEGQRPGVGLTAALEGVLMVEDGCLLVGYANDVGGTLPVFPAGWVEFDDESGTLRLKRYDFPFVGWKTFPLGSAVSFGGGGHAGWDGANLNGCENVADSVFGVYSY